MASTQSHQSRDWGQGAKLEGQVVQAVLELLQHFNHRLTPLDVVVEVLLCKDKYAHIRQAMLTAESIARLSGALAECGVEQNVLQQNVALRLVRARVDVETRKIVSRLDEASVHPVLLGHAEVRKERTEAPVLKAILEQVNLSTARAREGDSDEEELEETILEPTSTEPLQIQVDHMDDLPKFAFTDNLDIHASSEEGAASTKSTQAVSTWNSIFSSSYDLFGSMKEHVARLIGGEDSRDREHERKDETPLVWIGNARAANLDCLSELQVPIPEFSSRKRPREDSDDIIDDAFPTMPVPLRYTSIATSNSDNLRSSSSSPSTRSFRITTADPPFPTSLTSLSLPAPTSTSSRATDCNASTGSLISPEPRSNACTAVPADNGTHKQNESSPSSKPLCSSSLDEKERGPEISQDIQKTPGNGQICVKVNVSSSKSPGTRKPLTAERPEEAASPAAEASNVNPNTENVMFSVQLSSADLAAKQVTLSHPANIASASTQGNEKGKPEVPLKPFLSSTAAKIGLRGKRMKISTEVVRRSVSPHLPNLHDSPGFAAASNTSAPADEEAGSSSQSLMTPPIPVPVSVQVPAPKIVYDARHRSGSPANSSRTKSTSVSQVHPPGDGETTTSIFSKSNAKSMPKSVSRTSTPNTSIPDPSEPGPQVTETSGEEERTSFPAPVYPSVAANISSNIVTSMGPKDWLDSGLSTNGNPNATLDSNSKLGANINAFAMDPSDWPAPMSLPVSTRRLLNLPTSYAPFEFPQTSTSGVSSSSDRIRSKDGTGSQASTSPVHHEGPSSVLGFIPGLEVITGSTTASSSVSPSVVGPSDWPGPGLVLPVLSTSGGRASPAISPVATGASSSVGANDGQDKDVDGDSKMVSYATSPEQKFVASVVGYNAKPSVGLSEAGTPEVTTTNTSGPDIVGTGTTTEAVTPPNQTSAPTRAGDPKPTKRGRPRLPKKPVNVQANGRVDDYGKEGRKQGQQGLGGTIKLYTCKKCLKNYKTKKYYEDHVRWHDGATPYKCLVKGCTKVFSVYSSYRRHARSPHEELAESKVNDNEKEVKDGGDDHTVSEILQAPAEDNGSSAVEMPSTAEDFRREPELSSSSPTVGVPLSRSSSMSSSSFLHPFLREKSESSSKVVFERNSVLELPMSSSNLETIS